MNKRFFTFLFIFTVFFGVYLFWPVSDFPKPPVGAVQSDEPADIENPFRKAYFLDLDRQEVMNHYKDEISYFPYQRLNYPPEDAQVIIRDQTRSSYLEELTQPFRASIFVNGFIPTEAKDEIIIRGQHFGQKITVRYVPASLSSRFLFLFLTSSSLLFIYLLSKELVKYAKS